jgi:hypothetical protein
MPPSALNLKFVPLGDFVTKALTLLLLAIFCHWAPAAIGQSAERTIGPLLTDAQFFSQLDFSRPELAKVNAAVTGGDWFGARHALAAYFRNRTVPRWGFDPFAVGANPDYRDPVAEKALSHRFNSIGIEWQFGKDIDWSFNPTTQPDSKWPRNNEWTWQLSRHQAWAALARAFYATGDEKYARELASELRSWVHDCPVPAQTVDNRPFSRWRTIEAGIRAGTVWPEIFPRVLASKGFDDDALTLMIKSYVEHAQYLMKFHTHGNWLTMEANGLYHVGALFPEFKDAALWRETAIDRLDRELDVQVYPDGVQYELAPGYHGVALNNFLGPVRLESATGFAVPRDYLAKTGKMFDYFLYSMQPSRCMAPLNDSGPNSIVGFMTEGAKLFPNRAEFQWIASSGRDGSPPGRTSVEFPYAGQFFMRSGWESNALWLCMDGGPFGAGHQHEDKLSVILTAFGRPLLVEGGTYTYDASEWRRYIISSRAHNVVLVDGLEQDRRREPADTYVVKTPLPHVWESNAEFDHAAADYDQGYGPDGDRLVCQTRHVFFIKPDTFVIADILEPHDDRPHSYDALFHLDAPDATVLGLRVDTKCPGPNLSVQSFGADSVRIVKGQTKPEVQGWVPDREGGYGSMRPIPTAIFRKVARGRVVELYALCPSPKAAECPVTGIELADDTLRVHFATRNDAVIHFKPFPEAK